jgi:hypothetical protein
MGDLSMKNDEIIALLRCCLTSSCETNRDLESANIVDGLFAIARAGDRIADALHALGNADAVTPMGAIEGFGAHIGEKLDALIATINLKREDEP